jgi:hypothetical protein
MSTGYGYAPTGGQDQVDYAGIGAKAGEDIFNELDKREAKRTAIDTQEQKDFSHLKNDIPQGDDQSHNTFLLNFGSDSSIALLQLNKELKSGKISPRDFTIRRQNMMDASDHILNMGDHYNKVFKEKMDLYNNGKIGEEDRQNMADIGKMTDFTKTKTRYNANGTVSIIGGDGNEVSTTQIYGMLGGNIPKYDMEGETGKLSKSFAPYVKVLEKNGIKTLSSAKNAPGYQDKMDGIVGSILVNPHTAGSILADNSGGIDGKKYYFTKDPTDKNPLAILKVLDPENKSSGLYVPQLSDAQMKSAKELTQGSIEKGLKFEQTAMPTYRPRDTKETGVQQKEAANAEIINNVGKALTGSQADREVIANQWALDKGLDSIDFSDKGLKYTKGDRTVNLDFTGKTPIQIATMLAPFTGIKNPEQIVKKYKLGSFGGKIFEGSSGGGADPGIPASFTESGKDAKGNLVPSPESVFNNIVSEGGFTSSRKNSKFKASYVDGVTKSLNLLPRRLKKGLDVTIGNEDSPVLRIKMPNIIDGEVSIPITAANSDMRETVKSVINKIYSAAVNGEKYQGDATDTAPAKTGNVKDDPDFGKFIRK